MLHNDTRNSCVTIAPFRFFHRSSAFSWGRRRGGKKGIIRERQDFSYRQRMKMKSAWEALYRKKIEYQTEYAAGFNPTHARSSNQGGLTTRREVSCDIWCLIYQNLSRYIYPCKILSAVIKLRRLNYRLINADRFINVRAYFVPLQSLRVHSAVWTWNLCMKVSIFHAR